MSAPRAGCFAGRSGFLFGESTARIMYPRKTRKGHAPRCTMGYLVLTSEVFHRDKKGLRS